MQTLFGVPIITIGTSGIYVTMVILASAIIVQLFTVFTKKSVRSISPQWIIYFTAMFWSGVVYGIRDHQFPLFLNNLVLAVLHVVFMAAILRFAGFRRSEWLLSLGLAAAVTTMAYSQQYQLWFLAFAVGGIVSLLIQANTMRVERSVGTVNPFLLVTYVLTNVFWTMYALAGKDWTLHIVSPSNLVACSIVLGTWIYFRPPGALPMLARLKKLAGVYITIAFLGVFSLLMLAPMLIGRRTFTGRIVRLEDASSYQRVSGAARYYILVQPTDGLADSTGIPWCAAFNDSAAFTKLREGQTVVCQVRDTEDRWVRLLSLPQP